MATLGVALPARGSRMAMLRGGSIACMALAGTCALAALVVGSPLEFGVALALCGGTWIGADLIESILERERPARRRAAVPTAPLGRGDESGHLVFVGGTRHPRRERFSG